MNLRKNLKNKNIFSLFIVQTKKKKAHILVSWFDNNNIKKNLKKFKENYKIV